MWVVAIIYHEVGSAIKKQELEGDDDDDDDDDE